MLIKTPEQIEGIRQACRLAAQTLAYIEPLLRVGMTTDEINTLVHRHTLSLGCYPAPLNYKGFPKSVCTSRNNVVCHGIPSKETLQDGDIINIDVSHVYRGYFGDTSATFCIGNVSEKARSLVECTRQALQAGIRQIRPGNRLGDIGHAIQTFVENRGYSTVRDFVGHGVGTRFHESLQVPHFGARGTGEILVPGAIFTVEPMINEGGPEIRILSDGWTAVTQDGKLSAQFEHSILVTQDGCEILTL